MARGLESFGVQVDWIGGDRLYECLPTISELTDRYALSEFGLHHQDQTLRFAQHYGYNPAQMLRDLGDDVHPVRHMDYTHDQITVPMLRVQNVQGDEKFEPFEISASRLAAKAHDIGECTHSVIEQAIGSTPPGDVNYEHKTDGDSEKEVLVRQFLYRELFNDVPAGLLAAAEDIIAHKQGSQARELFNSVERVGYYLTAMRAGILAIKLSERDSWESKSLRVRRLGEIAASVLRTGHPETLRERAERFPYIREVLARNAATEDAVRHYLATLAESNEVPVT